MMEVQESSSGELAGVSGARADFVASLGRRLDALRAALRALEEEPRSASRRANLQRRIHAMAASANVLGFETVADALSMAEQAVTRVASGGVAGAADLAEVSRVLDSLPSLVWGGSASVRPPPPPQLDAQAPAQQGWPTSVMVFGGAALASALETDGDEMEVVRAEDPQQARELARVAGPDVAIIDADRRGARELVETLAHDPLVEPVPVILVGTFDHPEAASSFVGLGVARVLPKPVTPGTLRRTVLEVCQHGPVPTPGREPVGDVTVGALADRVIAEVRRGLVDAVESDGNVLTVPLGEGTEVLAAVWAAVARVRELVTMRSGGKVRFEPGGPEGAIPLAPWTSAERRVGERGSKSARDAEGVSLTGRTILVVDDDPAVVWFMSGLLEAAGAKVLEAHDGDRALALAQNAWPDLVVSDVLMPGLDGFALCREIKRDIAIRDVPVILLSWKEDLLQRMRELGADADGYMRKEATASQVVARVREVLRTRSRVEARIAEGGEVRGRLDGLTPRLILQLACRAERDLRVTIRDAVYLYELEIRDGGLRAASRSASDGSFERGESVLEAVLGVSAGRFVIAPDKSPCRREFDGALDEVLAGPIGRAREALGALSSGALLRVERVHVDMDALAGYVAAMPGQAAKILQRLAEGVAPRDLLGSEGTSVRLLDGVLADAARHGAVRKVDLADGSSLDVTAAPPAIVDASLVEAAKHGRTPPPGLAAPAQTPAPAFTFALSPAPPDAGAAPAPPRELPLAKEPSEPAPVAKSEPAPVVKSEPAAVVKSEPAAVVKSEPAPVVKSEPAPVVKSEPAPVAKSEPAPVVKSEPAPVVKSGEPGSDAPAVPTASVRPPGEVELHEREASPLPMSADVTPGRVATAEPARFALSHTMPGVGGVAPPPAPPAEPEKSEAAMQASESSEAPPLDLADAVVGTLAASGTPAPATSESPLQVRTVAKPPRPTLHDADEAPAPVRAERQSPAPEPERKPEKRRVTSATSGASDPPLPPTRKVEFPGDARRGKRAAKPEREEHPAPAAEAKPARDEDKPMGALKMVLLAGAAGVVAFIGVSHFVGSRQPVAESVPAAKQQVVAPPAGSAAPVAPGGAAPAKAKAAGRQAIAVTPSDLPLPPGFVLGSDKGLLEVDTGANQSIYVDGTFVGHGPLRRIPLPPGRHVVKTRQDGDEREDTVEIAAGRRVRLPLAEAWK